MPIVVNPVVPPTSPNIAYMMKCHFTAMMQGRFAGSEVLPSSVVFFMELFGTDNEIQVIELLYANVDLVKKYRIKQ